MVEEFGSDPLMNELATMEHTDLGRVIEMLVLLDDLRSQGLDSDRMADEVSTVFPEPPGGGEWTGPIVLRVLQIADSMRTTQRSSTILKPATASPRRQAIAADTENRRRRGRTLGRLGLSVIVIAAIAASGYGAYRAAGLGDATSSEAGGQADTTRSTTVAEQTTQPTDAANPADMMAIRVEPGPTEDDDAVPGEAVAATATVRNDGRLHVEGAFPSQADAEAFLSRAGEVFGPDNIVEAYVIDASAPEPEVADVALDKPVLFESGTAVIDPSYIAFLEACGDVLKSNAQITMSIAAFTDSSGDEDFNLALSQERAEAIIEFYRNLEIDDSQLIGVGFGEADPVADNQTEAGRQQNRRAMLQLLNVMGDAPNQSG